MPGQIVVLGSINQDLVVTVPHLPQAGETVIGEQLKTSPGGKGANQAVAAARLGGQVTMVGRVGNDSFGAAMLDNLNTNDVDTASVERGPDAPTGAALIYVEDGGQNMIVVAPGANGTVGRADVERAVARLRPGDVLVMQLEIPVAAIEQAVVAGRRTGAFVLLNAAPAQKLDSALLSQLDALIANQHEAGVLMRREASPEAAAAGLHAGGAKLVIVTLGASGSLFCDDTGVHRVEAFPVQAIDTTGAGDAFMGALAVGIANRLPSDRAVRFANAAGAAATTALGAQAGLPRLNDLRRLFGLDLSFSEA